MKKVVSFVLIFAMLLTVMLSPVVGAVETESISAKEITTLEMENYVDNVTKNSDGTAFKPSASTCDNIGLSGGLGLRNTYQVVEGGYKVTIPISVEKSGKYKITACMTEKTEYTSKATVSVGGKTLFSNTVEYRATADRKLTWGTQGLLFYDYAGEIELTTGMHTIIVNVENPEQYPTQILFVADYIKFEPERLDTVFATKITTLEMENFINKVTKNSDGTLFTPSASSCDNIGLSGGLGLRNTYQTCEGGYTITIPVDVEMEGIYNIAALMTDYSSSVSKANVYLDGKFLFSNTAEYRTTTDRKLTWSAQGLLFFDYATKTTISEGRHTITVNVANREADTKQILFVADYIKFTPCDSYTTIDTSTNSAFVKAIYDDNYTGQAIIACYKDERVVGIDLSSIDGIGIARSVSYSQKPDSIKVFLWSDYESGMKPLADVRTVYMSVQAIYVDADNGDDSNPGTEKRPLQTLNAAINMVRVVNDNMQSDVNVYIRGRHYISDTIELTNEDSGTNGYSVNYTSWGEEKPVLTMGKKWRGFTLHDSEKDIYRTYVGNITARNAYFNNVRGIRARTVTAFDDATYYQTGNTFGYTTTDTALLNLAKPKEVEAVYHYKWMNPRITFEKIVKNSDGTVNAQLKNSMYIEFGFNSEWEDGGRYPTYFENAYEFLDEAGEWYLDNDAGYIYYIPRAGENMSTMQVTIPMGEQILKVTGESYQNPVENITFDNIEFSDVAYMEATNSGGINVLQNCVITKNNVSKLPEHAIEVTSGTNINFTNNKFTRFGGSVLLMHKTIKSCNIVGNEFFDISGNGVNLGSIHDPRLPSDSEQVSKNNKVNNNYFHQIGVEYASAAAVGSCYVRESEINHNEIVNIPYSGVHVGWGWDAFSEEGTAMYDFEIGYNYIHEFNNGRIYDGGGIYTLGASSLNSKNLKNRICGNYFENARNGYGSVYPDEGSDHWHIYNNVTDYRDVKNWRWNFNGTSTEAKDLYWLMLWTRSITDNLVNNNYSTIGNIENNTYFWENSVEATKTYPTAEWPAEALDIKNNAGIEAEYKDNFNALTCAQSLVTREREYTVTSGTPVSIDLVVYGQYMKEYSLSDFDITYWISEPDILEVSDTGEMTAKGKGDVTVVITGKVDGVLQVKEILVHVQ